MSSICGGEKWLPIRSFWSQRVGNADVSVIVVANIIIDVIRRMPL